MNKYLRNLSYIKKRITLFLFLATTFISIKVSAQSDPFECDFNAYLFQTNDIYALDLASGSSYIVAEDIVPGNINAAAYNSADGYIWGYLSSPQMSIVQIGKDFKPTIHTIPELPTNGNKYVGDINLDGIYYLRAGGTTYYAIDLNPESNNYLEYIGSYTLDTSISIHDWAFNAVDGKIYSVSKSTNRLYRITAETGTVEDLGEVPILAGLSYTYGAVYFDVDGNLYVSANQTGSVYKINNVQDITPNNITSNIFAFGPSSSSNDGARCPTAPVPQENCANGIDDDGDGLVDCDDPSCSGVSACPVITTTSGGNDGGLESNDRLANLITNRNYNRAKNNYIFDKLTAAQVTKSKEYKLSGKYDSANIPLNKLVPLGVIGETSTIESSPADLLALTNASDIFSVDYLYENETIGALMVIKTEDKVYEHSKFICDRFLGAELLSVSSLKVKDNNFIKSIIKQADGNKEFALSFSARLNTDKTFTVESHWNIDAYENNNMFYNFQIWSNSVDDLVLLAEEILSLLESNNKITAYKGSAPPPVFVRSAKYVNGTVEMKVVNTNVSKKITLEGGLKRTETSETDKVTLESSLDKYIDVITIETGALFDLGFRLKNEKGDTPDDLFVADAPWGLDNSSASTSIDTYEIEQNSTSYFGDGYRVERNLHLKGTTQEYLGAYRAFNPRFLAVDLSEYKKLSFTASGTGALEVKLLKGSGEPYIATVELTREAKRFVIEDSDFRNQFGGITDFNSLKVLLFNLKSSDGSLQNKELQLSDIDFNNTEKRNAYLEKNRTKSFLLPNPVEENTTLYFFEELPSTYTLEFYTVSGTLMPAYTIVGSAKQGQNSIDVNVSSLATGIYLYKLISSNNAIWSGKMIKK
ncbi:T9SS type A sorting domain-containing protein [Cellulophaga sp. 20_2_10]|uniref:T9SS type A sorting domain-containing protein n=1 Tax=Cellulophaga sp. 20_2_10 TaxID=2942476 RepID=UPI00201B1DC2|nr:T9SS type A sorting domain-containing protein [Cellulophaga sp. 20_2_10]MCL5244874.1 T9SS type A sorting domain-containing protein [Cellulophaga sp. 20_2_10]